MARNTSCHLILVTDRHFNEDVSDIHLNILQMRALLILLRNPVVARLIIRPTIGQYNAC
jgi:hypothetical protein